MKVFAVVTLLACLLIQGSTAADVPRRLSGKTSRDAPEILDLLNVTVGPGETAEFTCRILDTGGSRPVYLQWIKYYTVNGSYVNKTGDPYVKEIRETGILAQRKETDVLTINNVSKDTEGVYTCVVGNSRGVAYKSAWLTVEEDDLFIVPAEPKVVRLEPVNSTAIYVEWEKIQTNYPDAIKGYYVYYTEINENYEPVPHGQGVENTGDGEETRMVISGLKHETGYVVSVAGYTKKGDGYRSKPKSVTTASPGPSAPLDLAAKFIQLEPPLVNLSWSEPEHSYGEITGYRLYLRPKYGPAMHVTLGPDNTSYITGSFQRGVQYEFRAFARNENGYGNPAVITVDIPDYRVESTTTLTPVIEEEIEVIRSEPSDLLNKIINGMEDITTRLKKLEEKVEIQQQCDNGWVSYKHSCYLFEDRTKLKWQQATAYCSELDGNLFVLKTADQEVFITSYLQRLYKGRTKYKSFVWIGAMDALDNEEWVWYTDGSPVFHDQLRPSGFWQALNQSDVTMNCAGLNGKKDFRLYPRLCKDKAHFICEKSLQFSIPPDEQIKTDPISKKLQKTIQSVLNLEATEKYGRKN